MSAFFSHVNLNVMVIVDTYDIRYNYLFHELFFSFLWACHSTKPKPDQLQFRLTVV